MKNIGGRSSRQQLAMNSAVSVRRSIIVVLLLLTVAIPLLLRGRLESHESGNHQQVTKKKMRLASFASTEPSLDMHQPGVYKGSPWTTDRTVGVKTLGETPFARCDVHSVFMGDLDKKDDLDSKVVRDWIFIEERNAVNVAVLKDHDKKFLVFEQEKYAIPGKTLSPVGGFINNGGESPFQAAKREVMEELGVGSKQTLQEMATRSSNTHNNDRNDTAQENEDQDPFGPDTDTATVPLSRQQQDDNHNTNGQIQMDGRVPDNEPDWVFLGMYRTAANRGGGFLYSYLLVDAVPLVEGGGTNTYVSSGDIESQTLLHLSKQEMQKAVSNGDFKEIKWAATLSLSLLHLQSQGAL